MRREATTPLSAPLLFLVGAVAQYLGAAVAVSLFLVIPAASVAWARLLAGAIITLAWRRPWRRSWSGRRLLLAGTFGLVLAGMNVSFYLAVDRLPLGTAVAIEFSGPVAVAIIGARRRRDLLAVLLAGSGVLLLAGVNWSVSAGGVGWALVAAALWAAYIVLAARVSVTKADKAPVSAVASASTGVPVDREPATGVDGLAIGLTAGVLVFGPLLARGATPALGSLPLAVACVGVGLLSTVIPYAIDQVVLRRLSAGFFALLQSVLPAAAALVGAVVLRQIPTAPETVGIVSVIAAVALRTAPAEGGRSEAGDPGA